MHTSSSAKKVGIFFIVGMVLLGVITFRAEHLGRFFKKYNVYKAYFQSSKGVKKGARVTLSGMDIGEVKRVDVEGGRLLVTMAIDRKIPIREGSTATIIPDFLFGKTYVDLTLVPPTNPILPPGSVVKGVDIPGFSDMVVRFDTAMASLERLVSEDFIQTLTNTMKRADNLLARIDEGEGTMGRLFTDETLFDELKETVGSANDLLGKLSRGEGTMGRLFADETLFNDLKGAMGNANDLLGKLSKGEGTMGKLIMDETLFVELKEAMTSANVLLGRVSRGEGTLGKLVTGEDLYEDIKKMTANLTETVNGFRTIMPHGAFSSILYSSF
jgi:phospholipid/cholesterol/gamma-HCH transport system substrate-binding protein